MAPPTELSFHWCRNLCHDTFNAAVEGGDLKHVPPRERETPDADPFRVNLRLQLQPGNGVAVVLLLVFGKELSALSAFAVSEVAKVKDQNGEAGVCEPLRELGQAHLFGCAHTVRHSDCRQLHTICCGVVIGKIKEAGTIQAFALEYNFLLHVCSPFFALGYLIEFCSSLEHSLFTYGLLQAPRPLSWTHPRGGQSRLGTRERRLQPNCRAKRRA